MHNPKKQYTRRYGRDEHVMGKREASLMRRLQSENGMTEEEVREHKKYRVMLSDTQKSESQIRLEHLRSKFQLARQDAKWDWGSTKAMFMQKACEVLNDDTSMAKRLYKRYAGGLVDSKIPKKFYYRQFSRFQETGEILKAIDKTGTGQFAFIASENKIGFMHGEDLTMFSLVYIER